MRKLILFTSVNQNWAPASIWSGAVDLNQHWANSLLGEWKLLFRSRVIQFINDYHNTHIDILLNPCENAIFLFQYYDQARNFEIRFMGTWKCEGY